MRHASSPPIFLYIQMKNRKPTRLREYDYSNGGWYFVTICTYKKINYFGRIKNGKKSLNNFAKFAENIWKQIPIHYPEAELDYFQIMPNHIHGIIIINNVGKGHALSLHRRHTLSNIIGSFKSAVTKSINENNYKNFKWQSSFYDRIIRNDYELYNIRKYIEQNPLKWDLEKEIENLDI